MVTLRSGKRYGSSMPAIGFGRYAKPLLAVAGSALSGYLSNRINRGGRQRTPLRIESSTSPAIYGGGASKGFSRQYRFKRQSKKKRYQARKRIKRYRAMYNKVSGVANQKLVRNNQVTATAATDNQGWSATHAWSYKGGVSGVSESDVDDVLAIRNSMTNTVFTDDITDATKFMLKTCIMDTTLHNTGQNKLEIDRYHIVYRDNSEYATFQSLLADANSRQNSLTATSTDKVTIPVRGATLFDLPELISMGYIKILSKEKIFLGVGEFCNFKNKFKLNQSITKNELNADNSYFAKKGWTHTFVHVFKRVVGSTAESTQLTIGCTRSYSWFVEGENTPGTAAD